MFLSFLPSEKRGESLASLPPNDGVDRELRRVHNGLLYGALVHDLNEGLVVLFRKVRRDIDVYGDGIKERFPFRCVSQIRAAR